MDRRGFVKVAVGAGAAGVAGTAAFMGARTLGESREPESPSGPAEYLSARRVGGPSPRGAPLIPLRLDAEGGFEVAPDVGERHGWPGLDWLEWERYCGHAAAPGLDPDARVEDTLRYFMADEKVDVVKPWYEERLGDPVRPEHFPDDEFGATFTYRTPADADGPDVLAGIIIRYPQGAVKHLSTDAVPGPARPLSESEFAFVRDHFTVNHGGGTFLACTAFCTHFCCLSGYKEAEELARPRDAWDKVFCTCHSQVYEPREPVVDRFWPEPREGA